MRVGFSPGLGGLLQVGGARLGLVSWLLARRHGGRFTLRLEGADAERVRPGNAAAAEHDLAWLGLDWDDVVRQSDRRDVYDAAAERLRAAGRLYPCFESEEELAAKREQRQRRGAPTLYDRAMLKLTPEQRAAAEAGGKRPYWRFLLSGVPAEWGDMVLGRREVKLSAVSDPVVIRADGTPLHLFTSVVDDVESGVTHAVRGEDALTATGMQIDMMAALGARPGRVRFAHLPGLAEPGRKGGPLTVRGLRNDGIEPAALAGYLAALGTGDAAEPAPARELAARFDLSKVSRSAQSFDARHLLALNRRALRNLPFEAVRDRLPPAATPAFWLAVRDGLDLLREARGWWDVVTGEIVPPLLEGEAPFLYEALAALPEEPWDAATWPGWTSALRTKSGRRGKALITPLRLALTGEEQGPELAPLLPLMGRARVAERLRLAAA